MRLGEIGGREGDVCFEGDCCCPGVGRREEENKDEEKKEGRRGEPGAEEGVG